MISAFELFKIGIGPSSSHTVGPMKATAAFVAGLQEQGALERTDRVRVELFGSLAWTGKGHGTDKAAVLGLAGLEPETVDPDHAEQLVHEVAARGRLSLGGVRTIAFDPGTDIVFDGVAPTPRHPNTLGLRAFDATGAEIASERWCSVGGGFVVRESTVEAMAEDAGPVPHPFRTAKELLRIGAAAGLTIAEIVRANEEALRPAAEVDLHLQRVIDTMMACIDRGIAAEGELPGGLKVRRRAKAIRLRLEADRQRNARPPHEVMDWVSLYAIAVNEENAAGGQGRRMRSGGSISAI